MEYRQIATVGGKGNAPGQFRARLRGIAIGPGDLLHAVGDSEVKVFGLDGALVRRWETSRPGHCITVDEAGTVYVGELGRIQLFEADGTSRAVWDDSVRLGHVTAIAVRGDDVVVADARERCVLRLGRDGSFRNVVSSEPGRRGFLIPNGVLDLAIDEQGVVHVANPGKHRVEHFTLEGERRGRFGRFDGIDPAGFPGCCNPTNLTMNRGGGFVVTEKATPRVKCYDAAGELRAVVAAEEAFDLNCKNMDVAVDSSGRIYVVDTVRLQVCVFASGESSPPPPGEATDRSGDGSS